MSTPFYDLASLVVVPSGYKSGKIYAQKPLTTDGQLTFTRASTATRVNASGLIETVSSGVPRLDYTNSSCPKILLEPQRVNYQLNSQVFSNWYAPNDGVTLTDNTTDTLDPAGTNTAEKVTTIGGNQRIYDIVSIPAGSSTYSVFVKAGTGNLFTLFTSNSAFAVQFNLSTQSVTASIGTGTITSYGNGWYRCTATGTTPSGDVIQLLFPNSVGQTTYIWGAQWEAGAYATSYIPTTSAAVTRLADAASKTGISSLIGQTEGTIFAEINFDLGVTAFGDSRIQLSDGTTSNWIFIGIPDGQSSNLVRIYVNAPSGAMSAYSTNPLVSGLNKIAFGYKSGSFVLYINGVQAATSSTTLTMAACSRIDLQGAVPSAATAERTNYKQVLLFKTRLTNAQLAELTTL